MVAAAAVAESKVHHSCPYTATTDWLWSVLLLPGWLLTSDKYKWTIAPYPVSKVILERLEK
jgi:hypothetical protein